MANESIEWTVQNALTIWFEKRDLNQIKRAYKQRKTYIYDGQGTHRSKTEMKESFWTWANASNRCAAEQNHKTFCNAKRLLLSLYIPWHRIFTQLAIVAFVPTLVFVVDT